MTIPTPPRTQPRTWSPLSVAAGPNAMPMLAHAQVLSGSGLFGVGLSHVGFLSRRSMISWAVPTSPMVFSVR